MRWCRRFVVCQSSRLAVGSIRNFRFDDLLGRQCAFDSSTNAIGALKDVVALEAVAERKLIVDGFDDQLAELRG